MSATRWVIEPRDPLIARDGRPFDAAPGARAASLPFPLPSTIAGAVRTRAGLNAQGFFDPDDADLIARVREVALRGPLPVEIEESSENGGVKTRFLSPAPAVQAAFQRAALLALEGAASVAVEPTRGR